MCRHGEILYRIKVHYLNKKLYKGRVNRTEFVQEMNKVLQDCDESLKFTYRMFQGIKTEVEGFLDSKKECLKDYILVLEEKIERLMRNKKISNNRFHHALAVLGKKLEESYHQLRSGQFKVCLGSSSHLRKRHQTYSKKDFKEWSDEWMEKRYHNFSVVGSKDEKTGNQSCQVEHIGDNLFTAKLRSPTEAREYINFSFKLNQSLDKFLSILNLNKNSNDKTMRLPISYRIIQQKGKWNIHITFDLPNVEIISTYKKFGVLGIDINYNHFAWTETDKHGNVINKGIIPYKIQFQTAGKRDELIRQSIIKLMDIAVKIRKPIVMENLNFKEKRKSLKTGWNKKYNLMLSSFPYAKLTGIIETSTLIFKSLPIQVAEKPMNRGCRNFRSVKT